MKKQFILIAVTVLIMATFMIAFSQETKTIKGEVIDVSCYVTAGEKGEGHKACALACLEAGEPAGILEEATGKVYVVITEDHTTNPSKKMIPYVARIVEATGTVYEKAGIAAIDVKEIKEVEMGMQKEMMPEKRAVSSEKQGMRSY
ncbi:MAG: hypothetical protein A3K83_01285 [Omnitrophica WOR_2 bacterium RBG_13_44_8b]|nr:MAG: hypothetical protein A3K83_01285 [Omnitrophica WOR_2 bacterium RBG_13_44_8b]